MAVLLRTSLKFCAQSALHLRMGVLTGGIAEAHSSDEVDTKSGDAELAFMHGNLEE